MKLRERFELWKSYLKYSCYKCVRYLGKVTAEYGEEASSVWKSLNEG